MLNKPVKIYVPRDTTAIALGADEVAALIRQQGKKHGWDIEIIRNGSRGLFYLEPLVEVDTEHGRVAYGPVQPEHVESLCESSFITAGEHPLKLGLTSEINYLKRQQRLTFCRAGLIDPLCIEQYQQQGGLAGLYKALEMSAQGIVDEVKQSGLRGRGGAAFPAGIKWQTVLDAELQPHPYPFPANKYIVCNADEGDSGTFADRLLMEADPFCLVEGMVIAGLAVGAEQGYIYLRSEYPLAEEVLKQALEIAYQQKILGPDICGSGKSFELELRIGAGAYICGEETSLLESLEGKRGQVRAKPPLPALEGLFGQPTVVNNVLTLAAVPYILANGGKAYADYGSGRSLGTLPVQLAGNIKQGGLIELPFGHSIEELLMDFGAGSYSGNPLKAVQIGGPLGTYLPQSQWGTPLDYEAFGQINAMLGHGGIVAFDESADMLEQAKFAMEFCAIESCGKCTPCRIGSVRGKEVLQRIQQNIDTEPQLMLLEELCETMKLGSLCAMGGLTPYPVESILRHFGDEIRSGVSHG